MCPFFCLRSNDSGGPSQSIPSTTAAEVRDEEELVVTPQLLSVPLDALSTHKSFIYNVLKEVYLKD
jgi:hypothetical protein